MLSEASLRRGDGAALFSRTAGLAVLLVLCSSAPRSVRCEIQDFNIVLNATDEYIHYGDGYLRGPNASIDLRDLLFLATGDAPTAVSSSPAAGQGDDDGGGGGGSDDRRRLSRKTSDRRLRLGRGRRRRSKLASQRLVSEEEEGGIDVEKKNVTRVDIVSFLQPGYCAGSRLGCDWTELGVGGTMDDPNGGDDPILRWCCTGDAGDLGLCDGNPDGDQYGRLIVSKEKFKGIRHYIDVPRAGPMKKKLKNDIFLFNETGRYVVVFANCDATGRQVTLTGKAVWKSSHGYLPG
jgi:hypothetical protein